MAMVLSHDWHCLKCDHLFYDKTDRSPCPQCGNEAGDLLEAVEAPQEAKVQPKRTTTARRPSRLDRVPACLLGSAIFGWWWLTGARYTIDGIPLLLNQLAAFLYVHLGLPPVTNPLWYLLLAWLPFAISFVERRYAPWRQSMIDGTMIVIVVVWLIVSAFDGFSTYLAITNPPDNALTISHQIARSTIASAIWSIATTFLPEVALGLLWRWQRE